MEFQRFLFGIPQYNLKAVFMFKKSTCWLYFKCKTIVCIILRSGRTRPLEKSAPFPRTTGRHRVYGLSADYLKHTVLSVSRWCFIMRGEGKNTLSLSFETHNSSTFYLCVPVRKVSVARPSKMSIRYYYYYTGKCQLQRPFAPKGQRPFRAIFIKTNPGTRSCGL